MGVNWHLEEVEQQLQAELAKRDEQEAWALVMKILREGADPDDGELPLPEYTAASDPQFEDLERPKEDQMVTVKPKKRKLSKLLEDIAEASTGTEAVEAVSKKELAEAVIAKARARAAKNGTSVEKEESALWREIYSRPQAQIDYDAHVMKYESRTSYGTQAEQKIHQLALEIQKREGGALSYAQAYNQGLKEKPDLYSDFIKEVNEGAISEVAVPVEYTQSGFLSRAQEDEIRKRRAKQKDDPGTMRLRDRPQDDRDDEADEDGDPMMDDDDDASERLKRGRRATKADPSGLRCSACSTVNDGDADYCKRCASKLD
jgi:hypothetical protein